ncbi:MAG: Extracellular ligand-binding receptor [candidate division TM6 bacterium GW2011_GWF2_30_66]|nr:MAG: Extracellular ligand-binding receptor [candidate division TM6 bacterium GW2011_GWF2_30_66]
MKKIKKLNKYIISLLIFITIFIIISGAVFIITKLNKKETYKFKTIESLEKYVKFYPENYEIENKDWNDPMFSNFYKKTLNQSSFKKFLTKLNIKKYPLFNIQEFQNLLEKLTKNKLEKNLNKIIKLNTEDKCIVFGDLHAAIHSLVRDLKELEKQKIINNNLEIIAPNTYIIFLGDAINRAPYSLEVLNIILLLIEKNPEKVIYLRGNHEKKSYWQNFNLRRQIKIVFPQYAQINQENTLFDKIDNFFKTLPDSLTIKVNGSDKDKIILGNEEKKNLYGDNNYTKFMIIGEKKFETTKETNGLEFIGYDNGIAKWSTISCNNVTYQKYFNFNKDAFLELFIGQSASKSVIKLNFRNNNNNNNNNNLYEQIFYDPIFGEKLKNKNNTNTKNIYNIGSTMYLTGITAAIGNENKLGLETALYFNNTSNKNNLIKLTILDDEYLTNLSILNINKLLNKYFINTIVMPTGTPTLLSYLDLIKTGAVSVFFPYSGASQIRKKELSNIINFRASYNKEIISMIRYLTKTYGIKKFAFFYTSDSYGTPIAKDAQEELKKLGINDWLDLPHTRINPDFIGITKKIKAYKPDAIACISVQFLSEELINNLSPEFFSNSILFSMSAMNGESFERFLSTRGIKQVLSSVVPDPFSSDLQIAKEFRENMKLRGLRLSLNSFEGYIAGSLISEAINNTNPPITKEKIMQYFEKLNNYNFKGLELTFNPETRDLSQPVWIRTLKNKWIKY